MEKAGKDESTHSGNEPSEQGEKREPADPPAGPANDRYRDYQIHKRPNDVTVVHRRIERD